MKKIFVLGAISLMLLAVVLSGCQNTAGQASRVTTIRANSCDADTNCEVNQLVASNGIISNSGLTVTGTTMIGRIGISDDVIFHWDNGPIKINKGLLVNEGDLSVNNLAGNGNAYACIGPNGNLFRSDTACR